MTGRQKQNDECSFKDCKKEKLAAVVLITQDNKKSEYVRSPTSVEKLRDSYYSLPKRSLLAFSVSKLCVE